MHRLGAAGGYNLSVPSRYGGAGFGVLETIRVMEEVSQECLSTGFCVWCQTVCGWYIQNSDNEFLKSEYLPKVASGEMLAGTGMSNPMKHFADIEKIRVSATRSPGGFTLSGALPWVSNAGTGHCFAAVAYLPDEGSYLMAIIPGDAPGLTHGDGGHFIALEGSSTHNAIFKDVFVPDDFVLAAPCRAYIARIRPGFVLTQTGFGLGLVQSCAELMRRANARVGHVNCYLDDGAEEITADLESTRRRGVCAGPRNWLRRRRVWPGRRCGSRAVPYSGIRACPAGLAGRHAAHGRGRVPLRQHSRAQAARVVLCCGGHARIEASQEASA